MTDETRAFFALYNLPIEDDKILVIEKVSRNCHEIIMAWYRIKAECSGEVYGKSKKYVDPAMQTSENILTGCSREKTLGFGRPIIPDWLSFCGKGTHERVSGSNLAACRFRGRRRASGRCRFRGHTTFDGQAPPRKKVPVVAAKASSATIHSVSMLRSKVGIAAAPPVATIHAF